LLKFPEIQDFRGDYWGLVDTTKAKPIHLVPHEMAYGKK